MRSLMPALLFVLVCDPLMAQTVPFNPSFDADADGDGIPDGWGAYGRAGVVQQLQRVEDPQRGWVACLNCTAFEPGFPDSHAMLAQLDRVGVQRGQWYRLRLWARAEQLQGGVVSVSLVNRRIWDQVGLQESFTPSPEWQRFEFFFRATGDLAPEDSRLQIWFGSTGTLWLDDVELAPVEDFRRQWHPQLPLDGVSNALPNSSFEVGGAGWGCWAPGIPGWGGELYRLMGEWHNEHAFHGGYSWKLSLAPDALPTYYFDYFKPARTEVRTLLLGHHGWVPVERGRPCIFSAYARADRDGLPARMVIWQADGGWVQRAFTVGREWTRLQLAFTAETDFACGFVGLDLREAERPEGTLWLDALQWEAGEAATDYIPRQALEVGLETAREGNVFLDAGEGLSFSLRAFNAGKQLQRVDGRLSITDYLDRVVWEGDVQADLDAGHVWEQEYSGLLANRRGFFRIRWQPEEGLSQALRCAVIDPSEPQDSLFGMNHAFPWEFLIRLAQHAGVGWWRDWSAQWGIIRPQPDGYDFSVPDAQIGRILEAGGNPLVLLPFPSAPWAATPDEQKLQAEAGDNTYLRERLALAFKPDQIEDFGAYTHAVVEHYSPRVQAFEILNEPLFTTYALPARFGYSTADYIDMLRVSFQAARAASSQAAVVGGISSPPDLRYVNEFIDGGGLSWCDAMNLHLYPHAGWPESHEDAFRQVWQRMQERGEAKPIWLTEFGCYGDDDPPFTPFSHSDSAMNQALRPDELAAAADLVRFAAIFCAYGIRRIFYHAGTCAGLNQSDVGNVFFEYGGTPRKQYAAQAALARLLGPDLEFVRRWEEPDWLRAYQFRSRGHTVVILWARQKDVPTLRIPDGMRALDLMGNALPGSEVDVGEVPVYLVQ